MSTIDTRLHRAWLSQLSREYELICHQYRLALTPPVLSISKGQRQLGGWNPSDRNLSLSHHLIINHPWQITLQILKHEIAHQICSEHYGEDHEAHGPLFQQICRQLGIQHPFNRATADLAASFTPTEEEQEHRHRHILDKVRKLMALAGSDNEHEAALAMKRAVELLDRHQLDIGSLAQEQELTHGTIDTKAKTLPAYRKALCSLLEQHFHVRVICASLYDPHTDSSTKTIELLGRKERVAVAEHCYHYLEGRLHFLWQQQRSSYSGAGKTARKSYYLGVLAGFRQTLEHAHPSSDHRANTAHQRALIAQEQQQIDAFVTSRYPRLQKLKGRQATVHQQAYEEAVSVGRTITLRTTMEGGGTPGSPRQLLDHD